MSINRGMIPGTFTMGNIVCGFLAILSAFEGNITTACWFIILAGFLDALDGKIARLSGTTSQFGVELDSLADFLSFGVAPAVVVYATKLSALGKWGWVISIVFIMAASYRLARFNLLADTDEKKDFVGLPVPVAALALVTFIVFSYHLWGGLEYHEFFISMIVLFAFLMVSQVQYDALPDRFHSQNERIRLVFVLVVVVALALSLVINTRLFNYRVLLFPFIGLYILYGIVNELLRLFSAGVGKVTGRQFSRRSGDKDKKNDSQ